MKKKAIVQCSHCKAGDVFDLPIALLDEECPQCGACNLEIIDFCETET